MRKAQILVLLLAGCGGEGGETPAREPVQTETLTGLYRTGDSDRPSQLCIVARGGEERFGLATWFEGRPRCSGAGAAERRGDVLRLVMAGEEACVIEASLNRTIVTFPRSVPPGCAYYCAPGASFAGRQFEKVGGSEADALRARDLVGDALCG